MAEQTAPLEHPGGRGRPAPAALPVATTAPVGPCVLLATESLHHARSPIGWRFILQDTRGHQGEDQLCAHTQARETIRATTGAAEKSVVQGQTVQDKEAVCAPQEAGESCLPLDGWPEDKGKVFSGNPYI